MHDRSLRRTTNIDEVSPDHGDKPSDMWPQLRKLNTGTWFLSTDPYGTAASLGAEDRQWAGEQPVCTLLEFLELAVRYDKLVIFDLYRPPLGHPYRNSWIQRTLDVILNESTVRPSQGESNETPGPEWPLGTQRYGGRRQVHSAQIRAN
ncbi:glycerophosphodiester phosphodiesterase domain-containing protein 5-like [Syngnathus acus]|uniref:glycerophosphodiester phosphodiesterase domain-containing protein 5-like n=1 Tax=Syngnathus acus TaxID=161584 RepID=UPI001885FC1E|nr:glycerophosphodiester phosphodiesterase domain-containing protein 5-like [Syngnathus acus]